MSSMIVTTNPDRRVLEASAELAETVGSEPKRMCGVDCARTVQCRNAEGRPLCGEFCPALAAARSRSGVAQELPIWLRNREGGLEERTATFQRIGNLTSGMVVAVFAEPAAEQAQLLPASGEGEPQVERRQEMARRQKPAQRRKVEQAPQRPRLRLVGASDAREV
ncbi:MAG: hypothetical protein ACYC66_17100 [Chloroflexota bacterium]